MNYFELKIENKNSFRNGLHVGPFEWLWMALFFKWTLFAYHYTIVLINKIFIFDLKLYKNFSTKMCYNGLRNMDSSLLANEIDGFDNNKLLRQRQILRQKQK